MSVPDMAVMCKQTCAETAAAKARRNSIAIRAAPSVQARGVTRSPLGGVVGEVHGALFPSFAAASICHKNRFRLAKRRAVIKIGGAGWGWTRPSG